jgi:HlyD family secretion protein
VYEISHSATVSAAGTQEEVVNFQVRIRLIDRDTRMRPGMSCNVDIETETKTDVLSVPIQSVTVRQDVDATKTEEDPRIEQKKAAPAGAKRPESIVWVYNGATVSSRSVRTGISDDGYIEILSGLKAGEKIVASPYQAISKLLSNGAPVRVEEPAARKERFRQLRQQQ